MVRRKSITVIKVSNVLRWLLLFLFAIVLCGVQLTGCSRPYVKTQTPRAEVPEAGFRTFPGLVAVIAQPGDTFSSLANQYLGDPSSAWVISEFNQIDSLHPGQELIIPLEPYTRGGLNLDGYQTVPVLCYHKFSGIERDQMTVTKHAFEEQMRFLKEQGYHVITLDELMGFLDFKRQIPKKSVILTIDDGWRSTYDIAFPVLKRYGYPATLFIYTDLIVGSRKTLNWDLIREMATEGIDMQCHTRSHRDLSGKGEQETFSEYFEAVNKEISEATLIIKKELDKDVHYLAYPYGGTNHLVVALLRKLGYRAAFTVERGSNPFFVDRFRMYRSMIYGEYDLHDFEENLKAFNRFTEQ